MIENPRNCLFTDEHVQYTHQFAPPVYFRSIFARHLFISSIAFINPFFTFNRQFDMIYEIKNGDEGLQLFIPCIYFLYFFFVLPLKTSHIHWAIVQMCDWSHFNLNYMPYLTNPCLKLFSSPHFLFKYIFSSGSFSLRIPRKGLSSDTCWKCETV